MTANIVVEFNIEGDNTMEDYTVIDRDLEDTTVVLDPEPVDQ